MNLHPKQKIHFKSSLASYIVLEVGQSGGVIAKEEEKNDSLGVHSFYLTFEEIERDFIIPEEKWVPKYREIYWTIVVHRNSFIVKHDTWDDVDTDKERLENNLVFRIQAEAEAKLEEIKKVLAK